MCGARSDGEGTEKVKRNRKPNALKHGGFSRIELFRRRIQQNSNASIVS